MIIRGPRKTQNFTIISNATLQDERLSHRARGVLGNILSKPDTWDARSEHLVDVGAEGRDAIRGALRELEKHGYLKRVKQQYTAENGKRLWRTTTTIYEVPVKQASEDGVPGPGEPSVPGPSFPSPGVPAVGESGALASTEQQGTSSKSDMKGTSSPPRPGRGKAKAKPKQAEDVGLQGDTTGLDWSDPTAPASAEDEPPLEVRTGWPPGKQGEALVRKFRGEAWGKTTRLGATKGKALGRFFKESLGRGVPYAVLNEMVTLFFTDPNAMENPDDMGSPLWMRFIKRAAALQRQAERVHKRAEMETSANDPEYWTRSVIS